MSTKFNEKIYLSGDSLKNLHIAKLFCETEDNINCLDIFENGQWLITSSDDDQIIVYDCQSGCVSEKINCKKYGAQNILFSQEQHKIIHSSNKLNNSIRYLSLEDKKYIQYFKGHTKKVISLNRSPRSDLIISSSRDNTVRLWDLRSSNCQGLINFKNTASPIAAFDPNGLIFAVVLKNVGIKLYDVRSFDKNCFITFNTLMKGTNELQYLGLEFSGDGKKLLLSTSDNYCFTIDAFDGMPLNLFHGYITDNITKSKIRATFTPDSQFVLCGSSNGCIHVWGTDDGHKEGILYSSFTGPAVCVKFNSKYMMFASAFNTLAFWVPRYYKED